jgi:CRISPR-associated protein Cmr6
MKNLNLLFNKTYYSTLTMVEGKIGFPPVEDATRDRRKPPKITAEVMNEELVAATFSMESDYVPVPPMVSNDFLLKVCYPGLLVGIGNPHDAGAGNDEIGVGFSFDYVTGQPYIPGSTVKGVLRSHFKSHPEAVAALCGQDLAWVKALEEEIFENADVFFDAVVYSGNPEEKLIGLEFVTPHKSLTENPIPIKMIKILPDVRFSFRFRLKDSAHMTAAAKEALFKELLCLFGIGAKTNVGFGILKPDQGKPYSKPTPAVVASAAQPFRPRSAVPSGDSKKCPHCGKWNKRFNPYNGQENGNWSKGVCFNCKEKM